MKVIEFSTTSRRVRTPDFRQVRPNFFNFPRGTKATELRRLLMKRCRQGLNFAKDDKFIRIRCHASLESLFSSEKNKNLNKKNFTNLSNIKYSI